MRTFYLEIVEDPDLQPHERAVRVHRAPVFDPDAEWVDFRVERDSRLDGAWRVVMMEHYQKDWYAQRGILDAVIPALAARLGEPIYSSANRGARASDEWRAPGATAVWQRLCDEQPPLAAYDKERDRYRCPPEAPER